MIRTSSALPLLLLLLATLSHPRSLAALQPDAEDDRWQVSAEFSFTDQSGNQSIRLFSGGLNLSHLRQDEFELNASYRARYGRSEGEMVTRNDYVDLSFDLQPEQPVSPFLFADGERDPTRRLDARVSSGAGAKYTPTRGSDGPLDLSLQVGVLHSYQQLGGSEDDPGLDISNRARWNVRLQGSHELSENARLQHRSQFQPTVDQVEDYLLRTDTSLRLRLTERVNLTAAYELNRNGAPPSGVDPEDRLFRTGLVVNF